MAVPEWTVEHVISSAVNYRGLNALDVYIEDERGELAYSRILNNVLLPRFSVRKVFALRGREAVVAAARAASPQERERSLFVIDGDCDLISGKRPPSIPGLHRLAVYSLENLVLEPQAVADIIDDCSSGRDDDKTTIEAVEATLRSVGRVFLTLYSAVALHREALPNQATPHLELKHLLDAEDRYVCLRKLRRAAKRLYAAADAALPEGHSRRRLAQMRHMARSGGRPLHAYSSGKHVVLAYIHHLLQSERGLGDEMSQVVNRLAHKCVLSLDEDLLASVRHISDAVHSSKRNGQGRL